MAIARKGRCFGLTQVREDQTEIFPSLIAPYSDLAGERFLLRRLLGALTFGVETPTMVHATDRVAFDPAGGKLRATVRTAKIHDVRRTAFAPIKREALAHDFYGFGLARTDIFRPVNRMPKPAHELAGESAGTGGDEVFEAELLM